MKIFWGKDHDRLLCNRYQSAGRALSVPLSAGRALRIACQAEYQTCRVQGNPPLATDTQLHLGNDKYLPAPGYAGNMLYLNQNEHVGTSATGGHYCVL
jgi:hypothetical protein